MSLPAPRWLTPPQIAQELGTKPETIIRWIRRGELTAVNLGDGAVKPRFRVSRDALDNFLLSRTVQPPVRPARRRRQPEGITEYF